jgi:hypothetical protein
LQPAWQLCKKKIETKEELCYSLRERANYNIGGTTANLDRPGENKRTEQETKTKQDKQNLVTNESFGSQWNPHDHPHLQGNTRHCTENTTKKSWTPTDNSTSWRAIPQLTQQAERRNSTAAQDGTGPTTAIPERKTEQTGQDTENTGHSSNPPTLRSEEQ